MRIISYNVNGIRAAIKKGFVDWLATNPADIICIQETKALQENVDESLFTKLGYHQYWFSSQKKGYSGVAIFSKIAANNIQYGTGHQMSDDEGRVLQMDIGDVKLINAYFPSGTSGDIRQAYKYVWLDEFYDYTQNILKQNSKLIVTGDYNIAHKAIDIHDPKSNKNSSGFLPEERAWMDKYLTTGMNDSLRVLRPEEPHLYSWWSQRFPSVRINNKGWRIDYISVSDALKGKVAAADIYPDVKHSDHCPIYLKLDI